MLYELEKDEPGKVAWQSTSDLINENTKPVLAPLTQGLICHFTIIHCMFNSQGGLSVCLVSQLARFSDQYKLSIGKRLSRWRKSLAR